MHSVFRLIGTVIISVIFLLITTDSHADSSKFFEEDLDVGTTVLVRAELGRKGWFYWMDTNACLCWVGGKQAMEGMAAAAMFDCMKLKVHPKLEKHLKNCMKDEKPSEEAKPAQQPNATTSANPQPVASQAQPQSSQPAQAQPQAVQPAKTK